MDAEIEYESGYATHQGDGRQREDYFNQCHFQGFKCKYICGVGGGHESIKVGGGAGWDLFFQFMERDIEDCI